MGLTFSGVGFAYPNVPVLKDLDLAIDDGATAVMGPNGSGKTTLLHLAAGILYPQRGEIELDGVPFPEAVSHLRRELGLAPQAADFPDHLTPRKILHYLAQIRFLKPELGMLEMEQLGIAHLADRRFEELSTGEQRLVNIAQSLMGTPRILLLDEYSRNLGIEDRQRVARRLLDLARGRLIIFSTHHCEDVELLANRLVLLEGGKAIFYGQPAALVRGAHGHVYAVDPTEKARLKALAQVQISRDTPQGLRLVGELPDGIPGARAEPTLEEACLWAFSQARKRGSLIE